MIPKRNMLRPVRPAPALEIRRCERICMLCGSRLAVLLYCSAGFWHSDPRFRPLFCFQFGR